MPSANQVPCFVCVSLLCEVCIGVMLVVLLWLVALPMPIRPSLEGIHCLGNNHFLQESIPCTDNSQCKKVFPTVEPCSSPLEQLLIVASGWGVVCTGRVWRYPRVACCLAIEPCIFLGGILISIFRTIRIACRGLSGGQMCRLISPLVELGVVGEHCERRVVFQGLWHVVYVYYE